jgi:hypothetical protein
MVGGRRDHTLPIITDCKISEVDEYGRRRAMPSEIPPCAVCNNTLHIRDTCERNSRSALGELIGLIIARLYCDVCKTTLRALPSFVFPYKHYDTDAIQAVVDGDKKPHAADKRTRRRWRAYYTASKPSIEGALGALSARETDFLMPAAGGENILSGLKSTHPHWLSVVLKSLVNHAMNFCTEFVRCPPDRATKVCPSSYPRQPKGDDFDDKTYDDGG